MSPSERALRCDPAGSSGLRDVGRMADCNQKPKDRMEIPSYCRQCRPVIMGGDFRLRKKYSLRRFRFSFQLFILPSWPRKSKRRTIVNVRPNAALLFEADVRWPAGAR